MSKGKATETQTLEKIALEAVMATREGRLRWEPSLRPDGFRATIGRGKEGMTDLEIRQDPEGNGIRLAVTSANITVNGAPGAAREELEELLADLNGDTEARTREMPQDALRMLRELRGQGGEREKQEEPEKDRWAITRRVKALDEREAGSIELDITLEFSDPEGAPVGRDFWESALDYFLEYDDLNTFFQDTDYWHSHVEHILSGTGFRFDLEGLDPGASEPEIHGDVIRYTARETDRGNLITYTEEEQDVISRARCVMRFQDPQAAQPVLAHIRDSNP